MLAFALALSGTGALLVLRAFDLEPRTRLLGGNFPVDAAASNLNEETAHNSPALVVNPVDGSNLAIANRLDWPAFSCALHVSFDGASSWVQTPIPVPRREEPKCYAPDVAFGANGTLHLAFVTLHGPHNLPRALWVASSLDGGRSLEEPILVAKGLVYQPRVASHPADAERLHLFWLAATGTGAWGFDDPGNPIVTATSDDGGSTWSEPTEVSDASRARVLFPAPTVGPDGSLYVAYVDLGDDSLDYEGKHEGRGGAPYEGTWQVILAISDDGGMSWRESAVEEGLAVPDRIIPFIGPSPAIALDEDAIHVAFHGGGSGDPDVWLWSSRDRGRTWRTKRVNDVVTGRQYLPALSVAPDGRVDVVYYDRQGASDDETIGVSLQSSFDRGSSFGKPVALTERPFDPAIGLLSERGLPQLGSRIALHAGADRSLAVWTDTRLADDDLRKQDLYSGIAAFSQPVRLPTPLEVVLYYGGVALVVVAGLSGAAWAIGRRAADGDGSTDDARESP